MARTRTRKVLYEVVGKDAAARNGAAGPRRRFFSARRRKSSKGRSSNLHKALIVAAVLVAGGYAGWRVFQDPQTPGEDSASGQATTQTADNDPQTPVVVSPTTPAADDAAVGPATVVNRDSGRPTAADAEKDNVIVIASSDEKKQLGPVSDYFAANGIRTQVVQSGRLWMVITAEKYSGSSEMAGPKERIKKVGKDYSPPQGYKPFSFNSVYGINISKL